VFIAEDTERTEKDRDKSKAKATADFADERGYFSAKSTRMAELDVEFRHAGV
jgi:hypothetical protein